MTGGRRERGRVVCAPDVARYFHGRGRESVPDAVYSVEPKVDGLSVAL